jgi:hypothetical protein
MVVGSLFDDFAAGDDDDVIGVFDRGETVGDTDCGAGFSSDV